MQIEEQLEPRVEYDCMGARVLLALVSSLERRAPGSDQSLAVFLWDCSICRPGTQLFLGLRKRVSTKLGLDWHLSDRQAPLGYSICVSQAGP